MIAIHAQTERKRLDRSVRCAEKRRPWARKQRLRGLIRPDPAVCATAGAACGRKSLSSARIQAIFTSNDTPLGECRLKVMERNTQEVRDYFAGASPEKGLDPLWAMLKDLIAGMGDGAGTEGYLLLLWGDVQEPSLRALAAERNRLVLKAIEARLPAGPRPPEHTAGLIQTVIQGSCMQWLVEPEGELAAFMTKRTHMLLSVLYPDHVFG